MVLNSTCVLIINIFLDQASFLNSILTFLHMSHVDISDSICPNRTLDISSIIVGGSCFNQKPWSQPKTLLSLSLSFFPNIQFIRKYIGLLSKYIQNLKLITKFLAHATMTSCLDYFNSFLTRCPFYVCIFTVVCSQKSSQSNPYKY